MGATFGCAFNIVQLIIFRTFQIGNKGARSPKYTTGYATGKHTAAKHYGKFLAPLFYKIEKH